MSAGRSTFTLAALNAIAGFATAGLFIVAARAASPENFGQLVTVTTLGIVLVGALDLGTNNMWVRDLARGSESAKSLRGAPATKIACTTGAGSLLFGALSLVSHDPSWLWGVAWATALALTQVTTVPLRSEGRAWVTGATLLIDRLIAFSVVLIIGTGSALLLGLTMGAAVSAALNSLLVPKARRVTFGPWRNPWRGAHGFGLGSAAVTLQGLDVSLIGMASGPTSAGLYGAVSRWTQPLGIPVLAFNMTVAPLAAQNRNWNSLRTALDRSAWIPSLTVAAGVALAVFADHVVPFVLGNQYSASTEIFQVLAISTVPSVLTSVMTTILQAWGQERPAGIALLIGVSVQLVLILALARAIGPMAGAIALLVSQTLTALLLAQVLLKRQDHV